MLKFSPKKPLFFVLDFSYILQTTASRTMLLRCHQNQSKAQSCFISYVIQLTDIYYDNHVLICFPQPHSQRDLYIFSGKRGEIFDVR